MNSDEKPKISATLVFEAIGKPPEYVEQALQKISDLMKQENGVEVVDFKIHKAQEMEKNPGFYSTFSEVEVKVDEMMYLTILVFKYMPAHIEVVTPESITMSNSGWSDVLSEITRRLHGYDEVARVIQNERAILEKKLRELMEEKNKSSEKKVEKSQKKTTKKTIKKN